MKGFIPFLLGLLLGYMVFNSAPVPCPQPPTKTPVTYTPNNRPARILDGEDRVIWERN